MTRPGEAILKDDCGNAVLNEPLRNGITLAIGDVANVATAGTQYDCHAVGLIGRRQKNLKL